VQLIRPLAWSILSSSSCWRITVHRVGWRSGTESTAILDGTDGVNSINVPEWAEAVLKWKIKRSHLP
jgi:hypothetical protein